MDELRVHLSGDDARFGQVPAADVARLMLLVEGATARAASVVLGRPKTTTGRYKDVIRRAVQFRLRAVESGSVVPVLELPTPAEAMEVVDPFDLQVATLGQQAVTMLLDVAEGRRHPHPVVAGGLA